jgi:hypothetical protein
METVLDRIRHAPLRPIAAEAVARGDTVRLLEGSQGDVRVETIVLMPSLRAAQAAGTVVLWGTWSGERLLTDTGGHLLDVDGTCFCRDCETAGGYCVDDDE